MLAFVLPGFVWVPLRLDFVVEVIVGFNLGLGFVLIAVCIVYFGLT